MPGMTSVGFIVRFADDFVVGFTLRGDAEKVFEVLPKRFERNGLKIHPEKSRMVQFIRPKDRMSWSGFAAKVLKLFTLPEPRIVHAF